MSILTNANFFKLSIRKFILFHVKHEIEKGTIMRKSRKDSRIEIWGVQYINNQHDERNNEDIGVVILQIEPGHSPDDYIVEVVDEETF